jgi:FSR family fosmidomycin resistance protein-like MFS transporter
MESRTLRNVTLVSITLLLVAFLDEFVYGAREAAWPLIRTTFGLDYAQVGLLLSLPNVMANAVEPFLGILGDVWKRRILILAGGVTYALALLLFAASWDFPVLLLAAVLLAPAASTFVSLSQATRSSRHSCSCPASISRWCCWGCWASATPAGIRSSKAGYTLPCRGRAVRCSRWAACSAWPGRCFHSRWGWRPNASI